MWTCLQQPERHGLASFAGQSCGQGLHDSPHSAVVPGDDGHRQLPSGGHRGRRERPGGLGTRDNHCYDRRANRRLLLSLILKNAGDRVATLRCVGGGDGVADGLWTCLQQPERHGLASSAGQPCGQGLHDPPHSAVVPGDDGHRQLPSGEHRGRRERPGGLGIQHRRRFRSRFRRRRGPDRYHGNAAYLRRLPGLVREGAGERMDTGFAGSGESVLAGLGSFRQQPDRLRWAAGRSVHDPPHSAVVSGGDNHRHCIARIHQRW